jgi:hypothetical protein
VITADDLAGMQGVLEDSMPDTAIIYREVRTPDTSMGFTTTLEPGDPIKVRMAPLAGGVGGAMAEALIAGRIGTAEAWIFSFPVDVDIRATDQFTVNGDAGFEVALILEPRSWELNRRVVGVRLA